MAQLLLGFLEGTVSQILSKVKVLVSWLRAPKRKVEQFRKKALWRVIGSSPRRTLRTMAP